MWRRRMKGCYQSIKIWQQMMSVRSLAWSRSEEVFSRLKFASLCRKKGKTALSLKVLRGATQKLTSELVYKLEHNAFERVARRASCCLGGASGSRSHGSVDRWHNTDVQR